MKSANISGACNARWRIFLLSGVTRSLREIEEHIASGLAEFPAPTDADVRNVLERVGDPADIAAEARERFGIKPAKRSWTDPAAIILLLIGGFTIIGWFVGVVLLWISDAWNTRDKIIGTLVVPGGLAGALGVGLIASGRQGGSCGPVEVTVAPAPCATAAAEYRKRGGLDPRCAPRDRSDRHGDLSEPEAASGPLSRDQGMRSPRSMPPKPHPPVSSCFSAMSRAAADATSRNRSSGDVGPVICRM